MNKNWNDLIQQMPVLLNQLTSQPSRPWNNRGVLPQKGVYVFYEKGEPIYTGRSNNVKQRISEHCRPSSGHTSATFAFNMAKREAIKEGININVTRSKLQADPAFTRLYLKAKERVSRMDVRAIQIDDPIMQTLFEVYAAMCLDTKEYNDFDTH